MFRKPFSPLAIAIALCAVTAWVAAAPAAAQTVDEIIAQYLAARGGADKIAAVQSAVYTGRMMIGPGAEAPLRLEWKRPGKVRMDFTFQGMTGIQAYDGETGWMVMPFLGKLDPEKMSADDLKDIEEMADFFDGALKDYAAKGHQVELVGKEAVEGTDAWKLKLTRKNGDVSFVYLDAEALLEIKSESKRKIQGQEVEMESTYGDYKEVGGLLFAHAIEQKPKGMPQGQTITIETIELNAPVDDAKFVMPEAPAPAPAAPPAKPPVR